MPRYALRKRHRKNGLTLCGRNPIRRTGAVAQHGVYLACICHYYAGVLEGCCGGVHNWYYEVRCGWLVRLQRNGLTGGGRTAISNRLRLGLRGDTPRCDRGEIVRPNHYSISNIIQPNTHSDGRI